MRSFALFSLIPLTFGIFAFAAPVPGGGGSDDALAGCNPPADVGFVRRQAPPPPPSGGIQVVSVLEDITALGDPVVDLLAALPLDAL